MDTYSFSGSNYDEIFVVSDNKTNETERTTKLMVTEIPLEDSKGIKLVRPKRTRILIPKSITDLSPEDFVCIRNMVLLVYSGSYGEKFAKENNFEYRIVESNI